MNLIFLLFIFIIISFFEKNNLIIRSEVLNNIDLNKFESKNNTKRKLEEQMEPIRIIVDHNCLSKAFQNDPTMDLLINKSIIQAKQTIENLVNVSRIQNFDFSGFSPDSHFDGCVNSNLLGEDIEADLVVFIRYSFASEERNYGYAKPFINKYYSNDNNRPIIGTIIYNTQDRDLPDSEDSKLQFLSTLFLHEFTHILGFRKDILINHKIANEIEVKDRISKKPIQKLLVNSTRVLERAKIYYNCTELKGIELNNQITLEGEENCHWNPRLLLGDYMIYDIYYPEQVISEITLALLEDLPWYTVNYYTGGLMRFGKNKGCSFIENDCVYNITDGPIYSKIYSSFKNEFCSYYDEDDWGAIFGTCSSGRQSMGYCYGKASSNDLTKYKRDYKTRYGFGREFIENCPVTYEIDSKGEQEQDKTGFYYGNCRIGLGKYGQYLTLIEDLKPNNIYSNITNLIKDNYSDTSFCALSSILKKIEKEVQQLIKGNFRPTCYQMNCSDSSLTIKIDNEYIVCPREGGLIQIGGNFTEFEGYLYCPDYNLICTGNIVCNNIFDCVRNKSEVKNSSFIYEYSNKNISLGVKSISTIEDNPIIGYELSNNGECPLNCRQCISYHQCIICRDTFENYVGTQENDTNPIECFSNSPGDGYYNTSLYRPGKIYYFKCIENCAKCKKGTEYKCDQCQPTHFLNNITYTCDEERIPGCQTYDNFSLFNDSERNANGSAYSKCYDCNNSAGYYCVDGNKSICLNLSDYNNKTYYNMENKLYPCVQKCYKKYNGCEECNNITCTKCLDNNTFINHYNNCVKNITHCTLHNIFNNNSECEQCDSGSGYYCIKNDTENCYPINNISLYYNYTYKNKIICYEKCDIYDPLCLTCNKTNCKTCRAGYISNKNNKCIKIIDNCLIQNFDVDYEDCIQCKNNYYCIDNKTGICKEVDNINDFYYKYTDRCYKRCNETYQNCKKCNKSNCEICFDGYKINKNNKCIKEIDNCLVQNFDVDYEDCIKCKNNYYCIDDKTEFCKLIDNIDVYYNYTYRCYKRCDNTYPNCLKCNSTNCIECKEGFVVNDNNKCVEKIEHCKKQNLEINEKQCLECNDAEKYYCINNNTEYCNRINDIELEFYYSYNYNEKIKCYQRCNNTFKNCLNCNKDGCTKCIDGYFPYNGVCMENITGCINNSYNGIYKECYECDMNNGYYCLDQNKSICLNIDINSYIPYYYLIPEIDYPCYNKCDTFLSNCLKCNQTYCHECTDHYIINDFGDHCYVKPFDVPDNDNCTVNIYEDNKIIYNVSTFDYVDYYWNNIPYISVVDHYVGNNFTVTSFVHSECTEDLLNQGYYKIDTKELENMMIKKAGIQGMKILFSVFINYNRKNYLSFHNIESYRLDPNKVCHECLDIEYSITTKFYNDLNSILGSITSNLIVSEKIDFIERDSDIYKDICKNVTLKGIDIPLKRRLNSLYLHKHSEQILCKSENCTIEEYDFEALTVTCKCKVGNKFEDILKGEIFEFTPYEGEQTESNNDFIDSLEIIKCVTNGFKSKNIKANAGFFITIIVIAGQIALFVYYCLCGKPIININKKITMGSPPKKGGNTLMLISDWTKNIMNYDKKDDEREVFVQPIDDAEDQLLEEERTYSNDEYFDTSNLSIDTNVEGKRNILARSKTKDKADQKKVLILLSNKGKTKNKIEDSVSESDIGEIIKEDSKLNFGQIYWFILSLKQHIINYFSFLNFLKITESYIPLSIRAIRSLFMFILSFVFNILWINQTYYEKKFEHFNNEYHLVYSQNEEIKIPSGKKISYAISNTFGKALISFALLLVVQLLLGIIFFSARKNVIKAKRKKNDDAIQNLVTKTSRKYIIFFIVNIVLMIVFLLSLTGFCGAYGGGFVDYFTAGIISLIFLEIFPFLWSIAIALFRYFGLKKNNKWLLKISQFFMF